MDAELLREGIYSLNTRRFGTVAEVLVKRLVKLRKSESLFHDLYDDMEQKRVEVKFSVVRKKSDTPINEETVLKCVEEATSESRMVSFESWESYEFDCNIQQIKKPEFDVLYYGLFFTDVVLIFRINSDDIGGNVNYSDKQHKGNVGEGQFHINQDTLQTHLNDYLYSKLTYEELLDLLS